MSYGHANCRDCGRPTNYYPEVGEDESGILCDLCKWRNCDHEWAWEHARMLCRQCGWERPSTETMEYAQERIAALEAELERVRAEPTACYVHPETGHGSATGANEPSYEMTAYVVDWKRRAEKAEAEARRWEWVAKHTYVCPLGEMKPGEPGSYVIEVRPSDALLAHYEEATDA